MGVWRYILLAYVCVLETEAEVHNESEVTGGTRAQEKVLQSCDRVTGH